MKNPAIFGFYCALGCSFGTVMTPHSRLWKTFQVSAKLGDVEKEARLYAETSKNCKTNKSKLIRILVTKLINPLLCCQPLFNWSAIFWWIHSWNRNMYNFAPIWCPILFIESIKKDQFPKLWYSLWRLSKVHSVATSTTLTRSIFRLLSHWG